MGREPLQNGLVVFKPSRRLSAFSFDTGFDARESHTSLPVHTGKPPPLDPVTPVPAPTAPNTLYYGDNLDVLRKHVKDESVDLIYLDPPFKSDQNYNVLFQERDGSRAVAQVQAFDDTWHWDAQAVESYRRTVECGGRLGEAMAAFRLLVGDSDMLAYLAMMAPRLVEMHRVLRPTGSLYLHCDPTASHYLKLLLDAVFGPSLFRNEIVWKRTHAHGSAKRYGPVHDVILYYSREGGGTWTDPRLPHQTDYVTRRFTNIDGESGRAFQPITLTGAGARNGDSGKPWRGINPTDVNRHWAIPKAAVAAANIQGETVQDRLDALDAAGWIHWPEKAGGTPRLKWFADALDGVAVPDVWTDLPPIASNAAERLGYQTQKPLALLERIISASSKPGDVVLDPFCGCGTAVEASQKLGRRWVGIDIAQVAIGIISRRVESRCGLQPKKDYKVVGQPVSLPDARALAIQDRFEFQFWVVNLLAGRPVEQKKGKDKGIDGKIHFHDEPDSGPTKTVLISVKSGKVGPEVVRELRGVIERDKAAIGVLVLLDDPTRDMRAEAAEAGKYRSPVWGRNYPRLQLLTVEEILHAGDRIDMPPLSQTDETFAPRKPVKARGAKKGTPGPALFE